LCRTSTQLGIEKHRVIAKTVFTLSGLQNLTLPLCFGNQRLGGRIQDKTGNTVEGRAALLRWNTVKFG
jgi:hypothetical protein